MWSSSASPLFWPDMLEQYTQPSVQAAGVQVGVKEETDGESAGSCRRGGRCHGAWSDAGDRVSSHGRNPPYSPLGIVRPPYALVAITRLRRLHSHSHSTH